MWVKQMLQRISIARGLRRFLALGDFFALGAFLALGLVSHTAFSAENLTKQGLIAHVSPYSAQKTEQRLLNIIQQKGLKVFTVVDHSEGAKSVDLNLPTSKVIIFGNPKVGTPLMQCSATAAIDLPQKMLLHEDELGNVWIRYNDPHYLAERHKVENCEKVIQKIDKALAAIAAETVKQNQ